MAAVPRHRDGRGQPKDRGVLPQRRRFPLQQYARSSPSFRHHGAIFNIQGPGRNPSISGGIATLAAAPSPRSRTRGPPGLQARDRSAGVALDLLEAVMARGRERMAAARRAFDQLECPVWFRAMAPGRAPVRLPAPEVCLADVDFAVADADEGASAGRTARLAGVALCAHHCLSPNGPVYSGRNSSEAAPRTIEAGPRQHAFLITPRSRGDGLDPRNLTHLWKF